MRTFAFLLLALLASPSVFIAQAPPAPAAATSKAAFTAEDMLKVATLSVLDLSDDGRQVAVAARRLQETPRWTTRAMATPPTWPRRLCVS